MICKLEPKTVGKSQAILMLICFCFHNTYLYTNTVLMQFEIGFGPSVRELNRN